MSRMSDMAQTIEELRSAAAAISDAADWLTKVFSSEPQAEDEMCIRDRLRYIVLDFFGVSSHQIVRTLQQCLFQQLWICLLYTSRCV